MRFVPLFRSTWTQTDNNLYKHPNRLRQMTQIYEKLSLPHPAFGLMSHVDNLNYALKRLEHYSSSSVITYHLMRSLGTREIDHCVVEPTDAPVQYTFRKVTQQDICDRLCQIESGKFRVDDGLIVGLSQPSKI